MLIERSLLPNYLTNTYLVAPGEDGPGLFIDAGGPVEPLIAFASEHRITPTHILLTHHHGDHVQELGKLREAYPDAEVLAHPDEGIEGAQPFADGTYAGLDVKGIHTPGHTAGMLNFLVEGRELFTGDTLFKNSVGGVKAPGSTSYEDIRSSIMDKLMALPHDVTVRPGHTDPTTIGHEWENNRFVRVWRGLDPEGDEPCTVWDREARLVLWGDDYDGGHKAWIRWADDGSDDIVPGSQVARRGVAAAPARTGGTPRRRSGAGRRQRGSGASDLEAAGGRLAGAGRVEGDRSEVEPGHPAQGAALRTGEPDADPPAGAAGDVEPRRTERLPAQLQQDAP